MNKIVCYKRDGKFGKPEYLIPLSCLPIVQKRETEKAMCCGEYTGYTYKDGNPQIDIFGWIAKSMIVKINNEDFVPTWMIDKFNYTHLQYTNWINSDWRGEKWEVRDFSKASKFENNLPKFSNRIEQDIYWKNKFAEIEAAEEAAAFMSELN